MGDTFFYNAEFGDRELSVCGIQVLEEKSTQFCKFNNFTYPVEIGMYFVRDIKFNLAQVLKFLNVEFRLQDFPLQINVENVSLAQSILSNKYNSKVMNLCKIITNDRKDLKICTNFLIANEHQKKYVINCSYNSPFHFLAMEICVKKKCFDRITNNNFYFKKYCDFTKSVNRLFLDDDDDDDANKKKINPYSIILKIGFDIEVINDNIAVFPVAFNKNNQISSVSLHITDGKKELYIIYVLKNENCTCDDFDLVSWKKKLDTLVNVETQICFFDTEFKLLLTLCEDINNNIFARVFYKTCYNIKSVIPFATLILGYNTTKFDFPYILIRAFVYYLNTGNMSLKFFLDNFSQEHVMGKESIHIDLYKYVSTQMATSIPDFKLATVAQTFLGHSKVDFTATDISLLYYGKSCCQCKRIDNNEVKIDGIPSMLQTIYYNCIDCKLLTELFDKFDLAPLLLEKVNFFHRPSIESLTRGKSFTAPFAIDIQNLCGGANAEQTRVRTLQTFFSAHIQHEFYYEIKNILDLKSIDMCHEEESENGALKFVPSEVLGESKMKIFNVKEEKDIEARYVGALNAALPGLYFGIFSADFQSYFPKLAISCGLSLSNVAVIYRGQLSKKKIDVLEGVIKKKKIFVYNYERSLIDGDALLDDSESKYENVKPIEKFPPLDIMTSKERYLLLSPIFNYGLSAIFSTFLDMRSVYKKLVKDDTHSIEQKRIYKAMEILYKTYGNATYGLLGSKFFKYESLASAAGITFFSRIFSLWVTLYLKNKGIKTTYIDTDGLQFCKKEELIRGRLSDLVTPQFLQQREIENEIICKDITENLCKEMKFPNGKCDHNLEAERFSCVCLCLQKKKYILINPKFVQGKHIGYDIIKKGFEKNAIPPIKELFNRTCQCLYENFISTSDIKYGQRFTFDYEPSEFLQACVYFLKIYSEKHGFEVFSQLLQLNKQVNFSLESRFIDRMLLEQRVEGSKVSVLYVLENNEPQICLVENFDSKKHTLWFEKNLKNYTLYLFQSLGLLNSDPKIADFKKNEKEIWTRLDETNITTNNFFSLVNDVETLEEKWLIQNSGKILAPLTLVKL